MCTQCNGGPKGSPVSPGSREAHMAEIVGDIQRTLSQRSDKYHVAPVDYLKLKHLFSQIIIKLERAYQTRKVDDMIDELRDNMCYSALVWRRLLEYKDQYPDALYYEPDEERPGPKLPPREEIIEAMYAGIRDALMKNLVDECSADTINEIAEEEEALAEIAELKHELIEAFAGRINGKRNAGQYSPFTEDAIADCSDGCGPDCPFMEKCNGVHETDYYPTTEYMREAGIHEIRTQNWPLEVTEGLEKLGYTVEVWGSEDPEYVRVLVIPPKSCNAPPVTMQTGTLVGKSGDLGIIVLRDGSIILAEVS